MNKLFLRIGIVIAAIAAILLAVNAFFVWKTGARLESQLAALKAAGEPIALKDLAHAPIPPEKNAATFLRRAHGDLEAIQKELSAMFPETGIPVEPLSPSQQEKLQKLFEAYPKVMPLLEQAAACPDYDPQLDYTVSANTFLSKYLESQENRLSARVLRARSAFLVAKGRRDESLAGMTLLLQLCRHFDREPMLVGGQIAIACRGTAIQGANAVLQAGPIGKDAREALDREISQYDGVQAYVGMLKTERAVGLDMVRAMPWAQSWFGRAFDYAGQSYYLDVIQEYADAASRPYYETRPAEPVADKHSWLTPPFVGIVDMLRPALDATRISMENNRATVRALRLLNALQTKIGADANQPPKLSDLGLPPEVTTDPFDGQPLRVKKLPHGWLIYSVGPNRIDDGGVLDYKTDVGIGPPEYDRKADKK